MNSVQKGKHAENLAAKALQRQGYGVHVLNWRTPACEIDIIASKNGCMYFAEVKYRSTSNQGSGYDYIDSDKLHHMQRAAAIWVYQNNWSGPYGLLAIEVDGRENIDIIELTL